jgi:hypothetical protein
MPRGVDVTQGRDSFRVWKGRIKRGKRERGIKEMEARYSGQ